MQNESIRLIYKKVDYDLLDWKRWEFRINDLITFLGLFVTLYLLHPFLTMSSIYEMSRLCTSCLTTPLIAFNIISFFFFMILCIDRQKNLPNLWVLNLKLHFCISKQNQSMYFSLINTGCNFALNSRIQCERTHGQIFRLVTDTKL